MLKLFHYHLKLYFALIISFYFFSDTSISIPHNNKTPLTHAAYGTKRVANTFYSTKNSPTLFERSHFKSPMVELRKIKSGCNLPGSPFCMDDKILASPTRITILRKGSQNGCKVYQTSPALVKRIGTPVGMMPQQSQATLSIVVHNNLSTERQPQTSELVSFIGEQHPVSIFK